MLSNIFVMQAKRGVRIEEERCEGRPEQQQAQEETGPDPRDPCSSKDSVDG